MRYIPGDSLALMVAENQDWGYVKNISFDTKYPANGIGRRVTYVKISVMIFFYIIPQ